MANSLLTIDMITREAVRLFRNANSFIRNISTAYDDQYAVTGAKIGDTLRIRLPNDYTVTDGPGASPQDTTEQMIPLTIGYQRHVDVSFSSQQRTLSLDDFSTRILAPMVNNLAGNVALTIMQGVEGGISNFVSNTDNTGAIISPTAQTWLDAGAKLDNNSAQRPGRKGILAPNTMARTVGSLAGLFNPAGKVSSQYNSGMMGDQALGFDWYMDQTVLAHTTANYTNNITVSGANQDGTSITTSAITGGLAKGEIITFEGVFAVNRVTKQSTGYLQQFVVTQAVATGGTTVNIYPALVPPVGGADVQYQTVTASPANGADVLVVTQPAEIYRKNFIYVPEAVTLATADLVMPTGGVIEASRVNYDGISMRMISDYNIMTDQYITRLDVLFGSLWIRPEWAVVVADVA